MREKMILDYIRKTRGYVNKQFAARLVEDVMEDASEIIVKCVDRYLNGETNHTSESLDKYIYTSLKFGLGQKAKTCSLVRQPKSSRKVIEGFKNDPEITAEQFKCQNIDWSTEEEMIKKRYTQCEYAKFIEKELMEHKFLNKRERQIVSMRANGFTDTEIGRALGISHVQVINLKRRIERVVRMILKGDI